MENDILDYYWTTEESHSDNTVSMLDYLENHLPDNFEVLLQIASYAEVLDLHTNQKYGLHASGRGDFYNHRISYEPLD